MTTPPTLRVGCPLWAQRAWVGTFLPANTASGRELHAYSRLLNAVEGNTTFYATPSPATVARWHEQAHPDFRFVFKVPKQLTHERRLRGVHAELAAFCELMAPLDQRVGGFTLQLPPSFGPDDVQVLEATLRQRPTQWRWSVEVRHPAFFTVAGRAQPRRDARTPRGGARTARHRAAVLAVAHHRRRARRMGAKATRAHPDRTHD